MQTRGLDPETRLIAARPESAGEPVAAALDARARLADALPRAAAPRRRRAAAARAGAPPGRAVPGPARVRPRARLALRAAHRALRHARGARARDVRARAAAHARGATCSAAGRGRPALLVEGIAFSADGAPVEFSPDVRPRRSHPLLRRARSSSARAGRTPTQTDELDGTERPTSCAGAVRHAGSRGSARQHVGRPHPADSSAHAPGGASSWHARPTRLADSSAIARARSRRACGGSTTHPSPPSGSGGADAGRRRPSRRRRRRRRPRRRARRRPARPSMRWYCCLGAGDAPEQVAVEKKVIDDFNAAHPDIQVTGRVRDLRRRPTTSWRPRSPAATRPTSSARSASAARTPSPASGWTCAR